MANRNNVSASQVDILEQWLNVDLDSDEGENGENSISTRNAVISNSDNEFSHNDEAFVITSDHESNSEISDQDCPLVHKVPAANLHDMCKNCVQFMFISRLN